MRASEMHRIAFASRSVVDLVAVVADPGATGAATSAAAHLGADVHLGDDALVGRAGVEALDLLLSVHADAALLSAHLVTPPVAQAAGYSKVSHFDDRSGA